MGPKVELAARREDRLQEAVASLAELGIEATFRATAGSDRARVEMLADHASQPVGHVDVAITNAGMTPPMASMADAPIEDVERVLAVTFCGVRHTVA